MSKITRRDFLRWAGMMGGASLFAGCSLFGDKVSTPEYIMGAPASDPVESLRGIKTVYTVCGSCPGNCGISARLAEGVLVKIGGNPYNPVSSGNPVDWSAEVSPTRVAAGSVCALGGSGIQSLYDPYRVVKPLKRMGKRGNATWAAIPWEQALSEIIQGGDLFGEGRVPGLKAARERKAVLGILTGELEFGSGLFLSRFAQAFPGAALINDGSGKSKENLRIAAGKVFQTDFTDIFVDYRTAACVIGFGDAPLDSGYPLPQLARDIANARVGSHGMQWAVVDPRLSVSASKADMWIPVHPGTDGAFALAVMRSLMDRYPAVTPPPEEIRRQALQLSVEDHATRSETSADLAHAVADMIVRGGTKTAVFPGPGITGRPDGAQTAEIILSLNTMVGSTPGSGGLARGMLSLLAPAADELAIDGGTSADTSASPNVLFTWRTNLLYDDPSSTQTLRDPGKISLVVAVDPWITETSASADYILPDTTYLERFDVCLTPNSSSAGFGVRKPVTGAVDSKGVYYPIFPDTMIMEDMLIRIALELDLPGFGAKGGKLGEVRNAAQFYKPVVAAALGAVGKSGFDVSSTDENVDKAFDRGGYYAAPVRQALLGAGSAARKRYWPGVKPPADDLPARRDEFPLITYGSPFFRSADSVKNPWLLEIMPTNRALINPADAEELGIAQGDTVTIETRDGVKSAPLKAHVLPGIKPGVLALARGYGNRQFGAGLQVIAGARVPGDPTRAAGVNASGLTAFSASQIVRIYKS